MCIFKRANSRWFCYILKKTLLGSRAPPAMEASSEAGPSSVISPSGSPVYTWLCRSGVRDLSSVVAGRECRKRRRKAWHFCFWDCPYMKECKKCYIYKNIQIYSCMNFFSPIYEFLWQWKYMPLKIRWKSKCKIFCERGLLHLSPLPTPQQALA